MRRPENITFTGLDDTTNLDELHRLSEKFPIEWGVLFSSSRQGKDPRYPNEETLSRLVKNCSGLRLAAHLCGDHSRNIMADDHTDIPIDLRIFSRIQVNSSKPDISRIDAFRQKCGVKDVIAQNRDGIFPETSVQWLFDKSGGMGIIPEKWPSHPGGDRFVGYAGGIGPTNVKTVIEAINSSGPYWIDMESGVRTDDSFDLTLCHQVCEAVYR